eukprot:12582558-Prorocentrum_lima.AAC.1
MTSSLVGSEMCIRDREDPDQERGCSQTDDERTGPRDERREHGGGKPPVSYTHLTLPTICSV